MPIFPTGYSTATAVDTDDNVLVSVNGAIRGVTPETVRGLSPVNVLDFGASRTDAVSAAAQTTAFQAAYDYATPLNRPVYAPAGTYTLTTFAYPGLNIRGLLGDGPGRTIIKTASNQGANNGSQPLFWVSGGGEVTRRTLTQDALAFEQNAGSNNYEPVLHVSSGHGIIQGDYVIVGSSTAWPNTLQSTTRGEMASVYSVTSTTINLAGKLHDDYLTAASAYVVKVTMTPNVTFSGVTFQNTTPLVGTNGFILAQYCRDVTIENCEFLYGDANCAYIQNTLRLKMTDSHGQQPGSNETLGAGLVQGRLVACYGATQDSVISGCTQQGGTHLFTTGGLAGPGVPRNIKVANCTAYGGLPGGGSGNPGFAAFDTHEEGDNITFIGCTAVGRMRQGFQARCPHVTFMNCVADGTQEMGFWLGNGTTDTTAIGCIARNIKYTSFSTTRAFQVDGTRSIMKGCVIDGSETTGIRVVAGSTSADICDVSIYRAGITDGGYALDFNGGTITGARIRNILLADCTNGVQATSATFTDCVFHDFDYRNVTNHTTGTITIT